MEYKNCPAAWKKVKKRLAEDEEGFVSKLKETLSTSFKLFSRGFEFSD